MLRLAPHAIASGAGLGVFEMCLHGVTSLLEVKGGRKSLKLLQILLKDNN